MVLIVCASCSNELAPEDRLCPKCGSCDRKIFVEDHAIAREMIQIKEKVQGQKEYFRYTKSGEKVSQNTKRPTRERLVIDRRNRRKYHHVEEQDESGNWSTVHHEEESLGTG